MTIHGRAAQRLALSLFAVFLSLFTLLLAPGRAAAQGTTGSIAGTVVDEAKAAVPGATVTLVHEQTGATRTDASNDKGHFSFAAVPPGAYTVRVELTGFRAIEKQHNVLSVSGQLNVGDLTLAVGGITEVVTVATQGTQVETTNSDHAGLLTSTQIAQIQSKGRDVMNLLRLVPGVRYNADVNAMGDAFGTSVPNIGGARAAWNQVTVDGLNGNELSGTNRFSSAISLDAIAEVKVLLNTYRAEFGRSGGANIQIVSKSGTNNYAGSLYWYGRRDKWNANSWENNRSGQDKAKQKIDTYGASLGGPVKIPGLFNQGDDKKLFFFYSLEAPQVARPGDLRRYRMPTALERQGDFSQTRDNDGRLIIIRDPATGQPFPNNIIPQNRLDANGRAVLNLLPLPNQPLDGTTAPQYNFLRQETSENPRWNHVLRLDHRPTAGTGLWGVVRTFNSNQYGSEITAGPAKWGFHNGAYIFSDSSVNGGYTKIFSSTLVNELQAGYRRQTEGFETKEAADMSRLRKSDLGLSFQQFNPQLNPDGILPQMTFGLGNTSSRIDSPDFTFDNRLGNTAKDFIASVRNTLTWTRGAHIVKTGGYVEYMRNNEARGGLWMGQYQFGRDVNNPLDTNFAFSNALLGVFSQYTETDRFRETKNRGWLSEWFAQDTWTATSRLTVDFGVRFLWYTPLWREDQQVANFVPSLYDPAKAPRLYRPAMINGRRMAFDAQTNTVLPPIYIGAFVPGTGDETNGMALATDPSTPRGFRNQLAPQIEPRVGFAWDVFGTGKTALRASGGLFHNARLGGGSLGNTAANPPFIHNPIVYYGTIAGLVTPGTVLANRPVNVEALEVDARTPSAINWSLGVQQDIGWGTVVDVSYVGTSNRHMEMYTSLNPVPDGARFLDQHPENRDPTGTAALPAEFLRPYSGYQDIRIRSNWGTANYHALQVQANRRYVGGVQVGASYTWAKTLGVADEDPGNLTATVARPDFRAFSYSPSSSTQSQSLVINYTWDVPNGSRLWNTLLTRAALDGWQLSGENAYVKGDWAPIVLTTTNSLDFTGGDGGTGSDLGGGFRVVRPDLTGDPRAGSGDPRTGWFDTTVFARPARGTYGNAPRNVIQRPGIANWNLSAFKNFPAGGTRRFQVRIEAYNVLNQLQFSDIDRTAQFDPSGVQVSPTFGKGNTSREPRSFQLSLRFNF